MNKNTERAVRAVNGRSIKISQIKKDLNLAISIAQIETQLYGHSSQVVMAKIDQLESKLV